MMASLETICVGRLLLDNCKVMCVWMCVSWIRDEVIRGNLKYVYLRDCLGRTLLLGDMAMDDCYDKSLL